MEGLDRGGIKWLVVDHFVADDIIATLVTHEAGRRVCIMSTDRAFYQRVNDCLLILNTRLKRGKRVFGLNEILELCGVKQSQWCDYRALTRDISDDISGVPSVGLGTTGRLLLDGAKLEALGRFTGKMGERIRDKQTWEMLVRTRDLI